MSVALRMMSQTWDLPRAERPFGQEFAWFGLGMLGLLLGIVRLAWFGLRQGRSVVRGLPL